MNICMSSISSISNSVIAFEIGSNSRSSRSSGRTRHPTIVGEVATLDPLLDLGAVIGQRIVGAGVNELDVPSRISKIMRPVEARGATPFQIPRMAASRRLPSSSAWKASI